MAAVNFNDWKQNPSLYPSCKIQISPMEPDAVPIFVRSNELLKQLPNHGYQPKQIDRESVETQWCRVLAQSISAEGSGGKCI